MGQTVDPKAFYGYLFAQKQPMKLLDALLRGIANYISDFIGDRDDKNLSPAKLAAFYKAVGGNYDSLFVDVPHSSISWIYASIGCQHTLQPTADEFRPPSIPALTTRGFVRWQSIEILLGPEEHVPFIQFAVNNFEIKNPDTGEGFPKELPKEAFPLKPDAEIEKWHNSCAEKLRQQVTPPEEKNETGRHNLSPRPKVQTGYAHVRPPAYPTRERPETRDYFGGPKTSLPSRPLSYQHVSATGRPMRPPLSTSPTHRERQFLAPEQVDSPRMARARRRSFPDVSSPLMSPASESPHLAPPDNDHVRRHSHPRHARRGSYSSDASSEGDDPPSPKKGKQLPGTHRPQRPRPPPGDGPAIRFAYASPPTTSPPMPVSPTSRPLSREEREKEEEAKRRSYPIPIDLSGKLSAPFLLGRKDRERLPANNNPRPGKVGWKDLSSVQNIFHQSGKSSEEDRERERAPVSRRESRDEREKDSGGSSDYKRRHSDREREKELEQNKPPLRARPSSHEDEPRRDRERERERDADGRNFRDRGRRPLSPRGESRYYASAR